MYKKQRQLICQCLHLKRKIVYNVVALEDNLIINKFLTQTQFIKSLFNVFRDPWSFNMGQQCYMTELYGIFPCNISISAKRNIFF